MRTFFLGIAVLLAVGCSHQPVNDSSEKVSSECRETRAAFDVGSATTRLMVAEVDKCEQRILKVLNKEERAVPYKEDLEKNSSKEFSNELQERGLSVFLELSSIAKKSGALKFAGTATSAFRGAKNADAYVARIKSETGVSIFVIEQKVEAEMGFLAALSEPSVDANSVVVWDIGGGSMQFSAREQKTMVTSLVELGSVGFKNAALGLIKPKAPLSASPNPIGSKNLEKVVSFARAHAKKHTTPEILKLLATRQVVGVGGVHSYSILKQAKQEGSYDRKHVSEALRERVEFSDSQVGGAYAATDVTNLALVLGYLQELNIKSVRAINVNLTNGTVLYPQFWN